MMRTSLLVAAIVAGVGVTVVLASASGAETSRARTIAFLDDINHATQVFIDSAPRSPVRDSRSKHFRLSTGDIFYVRSPLLDRAGGTRIGTAYSQFTVVKGNRFANAVLRGHGTFRLHDGQIAADGVFRPTNATNTIAVLGGTGKYDGARGSLTFTEVTDGSQDTLHLLP